MLDHRSPKIDEVKTFWVVTYPTGDSELIDVVFKATVLDMMVQRGGGLRLEEIAAIFKTKTKAQNLGKKLLKNQGTTTRYIENFRF